MHPRSPAARPSPFQASAEATRSAAELKLAGPTERADDIDGILASAQHEIEALNEAPAAGGVDEWTAAGWATSVGVGALVADALMHRVPARHTNRQLELAFVRALASAGSVEILAELLRSRSVVERLAAALWSNVQQLVAGPAATASFTDQLLA